MKLLKWILIAAGALVLLFAGALAFIAATFDPNQYKGQVADLVKEKTQRRLTIEGDIKLMLFPRFGVHLGKTRLSEFKSEKDFAGIDDMRVSLALIPLLSKQVVVDQVQLIGLRAILVKHKDGTTNFDDLLGGGEPDKAAPPKLAGTPSDAAPIKLEVDGVRISKAAVSWKDEATGAEYAISEFDLKTGRVAPGIPTRFDLATNIRANQPKVDVNVQADGTLTADLEQQVFSVKALGVKVNGEAAGITGLAAHLQADIEARTKVRHVAVAGLKLDASGGLGKDSFKARLSSPKIEMNAGQLAVSEFAASVDGVLAGIALSEGSLKVPRLAVNLDQQSILAEGILLVARGKREADSFDARLEAPRISITRDKATGADITAALKAQGPQLDALAELKISGIEGSGKAFRIGQFLVNVDAKQADNAIKGWLSLPIVASLETRVFQLPRLSGEFDVTAPALPMKKLKVPLSGQAGADLKKQSVNADIATRFDESNIKAKFGMRNFAAPAISFDVAIDRLNIDKYMPPKKPEAAAKPAPGAQPEQPIDFSPIKKLDLAGSVRIGDLTASNIKAQNVRVDVKARDGRLDVNPLQANLYQGSVKGSASVNAHTNQVAVKQTLTGISIGPLLRDALGQDILEGRGNVALDVTSSGNLVSAMKKTLNGTARVELRDGAIKGINLAQSLRSVKSMFGGGKRESEQSAAAGEKTDFSELTASFDIRNGIAHNGDFLAKSPFLRLTGEGDINIPEGSLNYLARAAVVATSAGQGGSELGDLRGLTIPVRASGPFNALKFKLEFGNVLSDATKQRLDEKKDEVKGKLEDKLKSRLLGEPKSGESPPAGSEQQPAAPAPKPEDKLKEKLKKLF